jgi:hypothetical protein
MTRWLWIALVSNTIYWTLFALLLKRKQWTKSGLLVGIVHLLVAGIFSVAPFRSALDPAYPGFRFGLLHFEGTATVLPAATLLISALTCSFLAITKGSGKVMWFIACFDFLLAANQAISILISPADWTIQFGEHATITGFAGAAIMLALFALGPFLSGYWSVRRATIAG